MGEYLRYTNEGNKEMVEMVHLNTNDSYIIKYIMKFLGISKMIVTKEQIKTSNVTDIVSIPISSDDYINESNYPTQEQIDNIVFPEVQPPLQQEFKSRHKNISPTCQIHV